MFRASWTVWVVISADCGARFRYRAWGQHWKFSLNWTRKHWSELFLHYLLSFWPLSCVFVSPQANPNLLQRSEVVALINTLHRFTESLEFVDEFREMWARQRSHDKDGYLRSLAHESPTAVPDGKVNHDSVFSWRKYQILTIASEGCQAGTFTSCFFTTESAFGRVGIPSITPDFIACVSAVNGRLRTHLCKSCEGHSEFFRVVVPFVWEGPRAKEWLIIIIEG